MVTTNRRIAITRLSDITAAPALHATIIQDGANRIRADGNGGGRFSCTKVHGRQVIAHFAGIVTAIGGITQTERTGGIVAPAFHGVVIQNGTSRGGAEGQLLHRLAQAHIDHGKIGAHFAHGITTSRCIAKTKASSCVFAPALDRTIRRLRADRFHAREQARYERYRRAGHAVTRIAHITSARARSWRIRARRVGAAPSVVQLAFVDVGTRVSVARIAAVARASAVRTGGVRAAIGVRHACWCGANTRAIAHASAFIVRICVTSDESAYTVESAAFFGGRASVTGSAAMVVAAESVDAIRGQALRVGVTIDAVVESAAACAITATTKTFVVRIRIVLDGSTRSVGALAFLGGRAGVAHARTRGIAAETIDAVHRCALRSCGAGAAVGQVCWSATSAGAIAIGVHAFIVGIGRIDDDSARTIGALAFFRGGAGDAGASTS